MRNRCKGKRDVGWRGSIPGAPVLASGGGGDHALSRNTGTQQEGLWHAGEQLLPALGLSDEVGRVSLNFGLDGLPDVCRGLGLVQGWVLCGKCSDHCNCFPACSSEVFYYKG